MNKTFSIISAVVIIVSVTGAAFFLEDRYAKQIDVAQVSTRLNSYILQDQINFLQNQIWQMQDRCGNDIRKMTPDQRARYREMLKQKEMFEKQLNQIMLKKDSK